MLNNDYRSDCSFFLFYFDKIINYKSGFVPLSTVSSLIGRTKEYLIEQAKLKEFELWFKVPDDVEVRVQLIHNILCSEMKVDLEYFSVGSDKSFYSPNCGEGYVCSSPGFPVEMEFLLLSFQDLRWNPKNAYCFFTKGFRSESYVFPSNSNKENLPITYTYYDFLDEERPNEFYDLTAEDQPKVFMTCKRNYYSALTLKESGVESKTEEYESLLNKDSDVIFLHEGWAKRFSSFDMDLYVYGFNFMEYKSKVIIEMQEIKGVLLKFLDLEYINFINFPEKLFYIFVVTYRNVNSTKLGCGIDRKKVKGELLLFGFNNKYSEELSTLIINTRKNDEGVFSRYSKKNIKDDEKHFESLVVMDMFYMFKEFHEKKKNFEIKICQLKEKFDKEKERLERIFNEREEELDDSLIENKKRLKKISEERMRSLKELDGKRKSELKKASDTAKDDLKSNKIMEGLVNKYNYKDDTARVLAPIIAGTDRSKSWASYWQ